MHDEGKTPSGATLLLLASALRAAPEKRITIKALRAGIARIAPSIAKLPWPLGAPPSARVRPSSRPPF